MSPHVKRNRIEKMSVIEVPKNRASCARVRALWDSNPIPTTSRPRATVSLRRHDMPYGTTILCAVSLDALAVLLLRLVDARALVEATSRYASPPLHGHA